MCKKFCLIRTTYIHYDIEAFHNCYLQKLPYNRPVCKIGHSDIALSDYMT